MTEDRLRAKVADTALEYLGCNEEDGSHAEIIEAYNSIRPLPRGQQLHPWGSWGTAFITVVAEQCGIAGIIPPECSAKEMLKEFARMGRTEKAGIEPGIGDIAVFTETAGDATPRLGIVYARDGNALTVIVGDVDGAVDFRVFDIEESNIQSYCCPDYGAACKTQEDKK